MKKDIKKEMRNEIICGKKSLLFITDLYYISNEDPDIMSLVLNYPINIPNTYLPISRWKIIGINHDGSKNTIDLCPIFISNKRIYFDDNFKTNIYENSS